MMPERIHLIERESNFSKLEGNRCKSCCWAITSQKADALVGKDIYFHKKQKEPSYFGGKILEYELVTEGENIGRVIFHFEFTREHKNVSAGDGGWSNEMKIV